VAELHCIELLTLPRRHISVIYNIVVERLITVYSD